MSAATDTRNAFNALGAGLSRSEIQRAWTGPIAANVNLPGGTIAGALLNDTNTSPVIRPFASGGTMRALGVVLTGFDNTGGAQGSRPVSVQATTAKFVDANAGGGNAIAQTDCFKPCYIVDNQTISKIAGDGDLGGMLLGLDADGSPMALIDPVVAKFLSAIASGVSFTQTYSTASATIAALTSATLTDSSTGAASTTLAAINGVDGTGSNAAPLTETKNAIASLAAQVNALRADILAMKQNDNKVIDVLQAIGAAG